MDSTATQAKYEMGILEFDEKNYPEAQRIFEALSSLDQNSKMRANSLFMLGEIAVAQNQTETAARIYQQIIEQHPLNPIAVEATFRLGWCRFHMNEFTEAEEILQRFVLNNSKNRFIDQGIFWLAESKLKLHKLQEAQREYQRLIQSFPKSDLVDDAYYSLGWISLKEQDFRESVAQFDLGITISKDKGLLAELNFRKGDALFNSKAYEKAITSYRSSLEYLPVTDQAQAQLQIGQSYFKQGKISRAITEFNQLILNYPDSDRAPQSQMMIGRSYFQLGDYDRAVLAFRKLSNLYPESEFVDDALYTIGDCYYNAGNYELAIQYYEALLQKHPKSPLLPDAISGIQWSMIQKGDSKEAVKVVDHYMNLLKETGSAPEFLKRKAELFVNLNQFTESIDTYRKIMRDYPDSEQASNSWYWIAEIYRKSSNKQEVEGALLRQVSEYPLSSSSAIALNELAKITFEGQNFRQSINYCNQLLSKFPDSNFAPNADYRIGQNYLNLDQTLQAENHYRSMLSKSPVEQYSDFAKLGLARVAMARNSYIDGITYVDEVLNNRNDELAAEAQFLKGELAYNRENFQEAGLNYLKVKYLFQQYPYWVVQSVYGAGLSYEKANQKTEAIKLFRSLLQNFPDTQFAILARDHIELITGNK